MIFRLFLLFALVPVIELYLLIRVGSVIGALNTIVIVLATAAAGAFFTRREGLRTLQRLRLNISQGIMPTEEMFDAVLIFVAGMVLITPGFLTDISGFLLLIPHTRTFVKRHLARLANDWLRNHRR